MLKQYFETFNQSKYAYILIVFYFSFCALIKSMSFFLFKEVKHDFLYVLAFTLGSILPYTLYAFVMANVIARRQSKPIDFKKSFAITASCLFPIPIAHAINNYFNFNIYPFWGDLVAVFILSFALNISHSIKWKHGVTITLSTYLGLVIICIAFGGFNLY